MGPDAVSEAPSPAPTPAPKESAPPKEVSEGRKKKEIERVSSNILYRGLAKVKEKEGAGTPLTESEKKLKVLMQIDELKPGEAMVFTGSSLTFPLTLETTSGSKYPETGVLKRADYQSDSELVCQFEDSNGNPLNPPRVLKREDVAAAQLLAEEGPILSNFEGADQDMLKQHISLRKDSQSPLPEGTDDLIKKAASEKGMLTFDDLIELTKSVEAQSQGLSPEQQTETAKVIEALTKLQPDGNLLDAETLAGVFKTAGFTPERFQAELKSAEEALLLTKENAEKYPKDEAAKQSFTEQRLKVHVLQQAIGAFDEGGILEQYFTKMDKGEVDLNQAKEFIKNFREGNLGKIVEDAAGKELTEEDKKSMKEAMLKVAKNGGLISLFLMIILGTGAENFKGVVSLDQK